MGDLRPDGNGVPSDDGGSHRDDLPDFPPEWGPVIIPDDASELDGEAEALRQELRRHARQSSLRVALGLPAAPHRRRESPLGVPAVIMAVAILTTLISLLVVVWGNQPSDRPPSASPTGPAPVAINVSDTSLTSTFAAGIVDVVLTDASNQLVRLGSLLPAVVLLVDRCDCAALVPELARAAPPGVTIVPVAERVTPTSNANIHALADPNGLLRAKLTDPARPAAPAAVAVLLDSRGAVVATRSSVLTAAELTADVATLAR